MAKKQSFFDFFRFSQKLSIRFERTFLQSFYTILWSFMCNFIKFVWLRCEKHSQIQPKNGQKNSHFSIFSIFSQTVHTIRTKASQKEKDLSRLLYRICGSGLDTIGPLFCSFVQQPQTSTTPTSEARPKRKEKTKQTSTTSKTH